MIIGFTGMRRGMTREQRSAVRGLIHGGRVADGVEEAHHGMCVGADEEFHREARLLSIYMVGHPPEDTRQMMVVVREEFAALLPPRPFLIRNLAIVEQGDLLLAAPGEMTEVLRSGTWVTIRAGVRAGRPVYVVLPDGTIDRR